MSTTPLSRQLRLLLGESPDALPLAGVLQLADDFVHDYSSSKQDDLLRQLEDELQAIHHEFVDHKSLWPTEVFLTVLHQLCSVLPSTSIISTWFDVVLRSALRQPKLPTIAVDYAKGLIIHALQRADGTYPEKVGEFRRRLLDLYLLDAFNEGSGDDVLEWAELDEASREKSSRWKLNLEDILIKFGNERPEDLMTEMNNCFETPSTRLQLLMLLNDFTSQESFPSSAAILATHPLTSSLLSSLLLDNSSTVCSIGLTVLVKILPIFAVQACEDLKRILPRLFVVLARILCWRERSSSIPSDSALLDDDVPSDAKGDEQLELEGIRDLHVRSDLRWQRLELTFNATASTAPSSRQLFTMLYYLFPCNVLKFLRGPTAYLSMYALESPYTVNWADALDEDNIRSKCEPLLRGHILHPLVIWRDADVELSRPDFWASYDVPRITSEASMLDLRNALLAVRQRHPEIIPENHIDNAPAALFHEGGLSPHPIHPVGLRFVPERPLISLQDMVTTSVALKSNLDVEVVRPSSSWPITLFPTATSSPSKGSLSLPPEPGTLEPQNDQIPSHVAEAISSLQREVLLLRNELNFELWLSRENIKHIGRLYQNRILSKNAEVERQGLSNKLRKYRAQVLSLERELQEHKEQASSAKHKYADWNTELQKKLHDFREEKKAWITEAATLRSAEKEAQARFVAQGKLLADAAQEVFQLQTQWKENQHKIDRLRDYERQIEQHIKMQRLWDEDFRKFNERAEEIELMKSEYRKMQLRLESFEKTQVEMDEAARVYRRQLQALEARLSLAHRKNETTRQTLPAAQIAEFAAEKSSLSNANNRLRTENADLREEVEEMRAMLEMLKGQVSGRRGLISEPRSSPLLSPSLSPILPGLV